MQDLEQDENGNASDSGSDSGSGGVGDSGSASGSGTDGSGGSVDGSGGNANGNDTGSGSDGSDGSANAEFGNASAGESASASSDDTANNVRNIDQVRPSRSDRERGRRTIRLGSADRNRDTRASADAGNAGSGEERVAGDAGEPTIRLGATGRGRPKKNNVVDFDSGVIKLSEIKDLVSVFLNSIFEIPAISLKQDFWRLSKDESKMLTDAVIAYIDSMPKSQSSKIAKFLTEHLPLVNLCMIGFFIVSERVRMSIAIAQVTKFGRAVDIGKEQEKPKQPDTVKTPLDSMFSN